MLAQDVTFLGGGQGGSGGGSANDGNEDMGASSSSKPAQKDVVIEDISDEPIDLSEIPF